MKITVNITKSFNIAAKPLLKKYHSLSKDLNSLEKELKINPRTGVSLGQDIYKIRLKISSKKKGKSGVARVISLVQNILIGVIENISEEEVVVNLITIFDKGEVENISDKEIKELVKKV